MFTSDGRGTRRLRVLLIASCLALLPAAALSGEPSVDPEPAAGAAPGPLLEALAFAPTDDVIAVDFIDWAGFREAGDVPVVDRADDWSADFLSSHGVAATDLAWQLDLRLAGEREAAVLRLKEGRDPDALLAIEEQAERDIGLSIASDGRTVVLERGGSGRDVVEQATDLDRGAVAESPFGRIAQSLAGALQARIVLGRHVCSGTGAENGLLRGKSARLAHSVGRLRPYQALGVGYLPGAEAGSAVGRYVFDYERPGQASRDREGRRTLMDRASALTLESAEVLGRELLLDVGAPDDDPGLLFERMIGTGSDESPDVGPLFAICGPLASPVAPPRRQTADVPRFAGPATLALSGGNGVYAFDEVRFGAREVRATATVTAHREPCGVRLVAREDGREAAPGGREAATAGRLAHVGFGVAPGDTAVERTTVGVDYATTALRVDSTCPSWSLRLVPLEDPGLPWTLAERSYPVRGATIAELVPQTYHVDDTWAAFARWHTSWQFELEETESGCDVTSGSAGLRADIVYPRWRQPADAPRSSVTRWRRFIDSLTRHELGHITIALQGAAAIDEVLDAGFSAETCERATRLADRAARRVHDRFDRLNDRYDQVTEHGATQGTDLR